MMGKKTYPINPLRPAISLKVDVALGNAGNLPPFEGFKPAGQGIAPIFFKGKLQVEMKLYL